jgi:hypothetical protein
MAFPKLNHLPIPSIASKDRPGRRPVDRLRFIDILSPKPGERELRAVDAPEAVWGAAGVVDVADAEDLARD